jgi:hypothetical protein
MEGTLVTRIIDCLPAVGQGPRRAKFDDRTILLVAIWAIVHDRPMNWACVEAHWPETLRPAQLPSPSTMSRRFPRAYAEYGRNVEEAVLKLAGASTQDGVIDARPLCVGGATKDPDAKGGRAAGHFAKGYKLFSVLDACGFIRVWEVRAMNSAEQTVALSLYRRVCRPMRRIVADGVYDSMKLHNLASQQHLRHYAPIRENRVGRRQQPRRKQLLRLWSTRIGQAYLKQRDAVERAFGLMSNFACGYKGLPNWVRRLPRVERWAWGKILLYHAYKIQLATTQQTTD